MNRNQYKDNVKVSTGNRINSKHNLWKRFLICFSILFITVIGIFAVYISDYSRAQEEANAILKGGEIKITTYSYGITLGNPEAKKGFIFYPGGKVEYTAYVPLLEGLAGEDIFCIIAKMPFHLAVFKSDAAEDIMAKFPNMEQWYIGGHSLGGAMAAAYAGKHPDQFEGLILLAAYASSDLTNSGLRVLTLYGSEDKVLNMESLENGRKLMPLSYQEICIEGGNHAQFGDYGLQKGDGTASIDAGEQRRIAIEEISEFIHID